MTHGSMTYPYGSWVMTHIIIVLLDIESLILFLPWCWSWSARTCWMWPDPRHSARCTCTLRPFSTYIDVGSWRTRTCWMWPDLWHSVRCTCTLRPFSTYLDVGSGAHVHAEGSRIHDVARVAYALVGHDGKDGVDALAHLCVRVPHHLEEGFLTHKKTNKSVKN